MGIQPQSPNLPPPYLPPPPLDPADPVNDDDSEFGVPRGYQERLAAQGVSPEAGGPYRPLPPGQGRRAGKQVRRYGGKRLAP